MSLPKPDKMFKPISQPKNPQRTSYMVRQTLHSSSSLSDESDVDIKVLSPSSHEIPPVVEVNDKPLDPYDGRKEICLLSHLTLRSLFPIPPTYTPSALNRPAPSLDLWLSHLFQMTSLPDNIIFHSLHLLQRLSTSFFFDPSVPCHSNPDLLHHRLIFTACILTTKWYWDESFSNKSWSVASRGLFRLEEVTEMEIGMLEALDWKVGVSIGRKGEVLGDRVIINYQKDLDALTQQLKDLELPLSPSSSVSSSHSKYTSSSSSTPTLSPIIPLDSQPPPTKPPSVSKPELPRTISVKNMPRWKWSRYQVKSFQA